MTYTTPPLTGHMSGISRNTATQASCFACPFCSCDKFTTNMFPFVLDRSACHLEKHHCSLKSEVSIYTGNLHVCYFKGMHCTFRNTCILNKPCYHLNSYIHIYKTYVYIFNVRNVYQHTISFT